MKEYADKICERIRQGPVTDTRDRRRRHVTVTTKYLLSPSRNGVAEVSNSCSFFFQIFVAIRT